MNRTFGLSVALLSALFLMLAFTASAGTGSTFVPVPASAASTGVITSSFNAVQAQVAWFNALRDDGAMRDSRKMTGAKDDDDNGEKEDHDRDDKHAPVPEPSTILSFGAALLIGAGVLYSRRARSKRN